MKAKREIKQGYGNVEARYKNVMTIIEKKMKGRLDSPLHLAAYLLNPHYSYADNSIFDDGTITEGFISCVETFYHDNEDNQDLAVNIELRKFQNREGSLPRSLLGLVKTSIITRIHTKRRNRLTTDRLNSLVLIQFNAKLISKKQQIKSKKISDVLLSNESTEAQGFLYEGGDDDAMVVYRDEDEEEMPGTGIPWSVIGEAVGVDEQLGHGRSARVRDLYAGEEFDSEVKEFDGDEDGMNQD
ncbi:hypothetical protein ACP70R_021731 [Stipagrostis hirtigluma subsp. patula]